jgi:hypothetical protein
VPVLLCSAVHESVPANDLLPGVYGGSISRNYLQTSVSSHEHRGDVFAGQEAFSLVGTSSENASSGSSSPPSDTEMIKAPTYRFVVIKVGESSLPSPKQPCAV